MSEKEQLVDRLYLKKEQPKKVRYLRPKNPKEISPTLTTPRAVTPVGRDAPVVPTLAIPKDIVRPQTAFIEDKTHRPISVRRYIPTSGRPVPQPEKTTEKPKRAQTAFTKAPQTRQAVSRARPPQLLPMEVRPTSAVSNFSSRPSTGMSMGRARTPFETTAEPMFRLKKSNVAMQSVDEFESFKLDPLYTSDISDEMWNDPSLIFYYIRLIRQKNLDEEFLYFHSQPATLREPENVYFLQVVSPSCVNWDDYYTLSREGVTSYTKNKGEFCKLEKWLMECSNYIRTKEIAFFARYEQWRSFTLMRKITQCRVVSAAQTTMTSIYFNVDAVMRHALLDLQQCCEKILKLSLVDVKSSQTLTLQGFIDRQYAHETKVLAELERLLETARMAIVQACDLTYEATGSHDSKPKKDKTAAKEKEKEKKRRAQTALSQRGKAQEKKKKLAPSSEMMVYTQLATQRFCYKKLSRYIRLCDYMLVHTLYQFVVDSFGQLVDFLQPRATATGGDITRLMTEVIVEDGKLAFKPSCETMLESIIDVWMHLLGNIYNIAPFSLHQSLNQYSASFGWTESVTPLTKIIQDDVTYQKLGAEINNRVKLAFSMATTKVQEYQPQLDAYLQNIKFDVREVQAQNPAAAYYDESLANYRDEVKTMDGLARSQHVHMLLVQLASFCDLIKPSPRKCSPTRGTPIRP